MKFSSNSPEDTEEWGKTLAQDLAPGTVIGLKGPVGAGKSVITRGIARGLGIRGPVTSPTYTLISQYLDGRIPLYHMDLYRIDNPEEFEMLGARELLFGNGICIIEWFELVEEMLPEEMLVISIELGDNDKRIITLQGST